MDQPHGNTATPLPGQPDDPHSAAAFAVIARGVAALPLDTPCDLCGDEEAIAESPVNPDDQLCMTCLAMVSPPCDLCGDEMAVAENPFNPEDRLCATCLGNLEPLSPGEPQ